MIDGAAIKGFASKVSRYFLDFLETDFKRQQAPRRKIQLKNEAGFRTAVPLRKYESLYRDVWQLLAKPVSEARELRVPRNKYKAPISAILRDLIRQHVDAIDPESFLRVRNDTIEFAKSKRGTATSNPEAYVEAVRTAFAESVDTIVVAPLLALLDAAFREQSYSAIESVYEIETDLLGAFCGPILTQLPSALNTYVISGKPKPVEDVLQEFFSDVDAKGLLKSFFEDFATADAYQELRDVSNYSRLGGEALQIYLYACELRFGNALFPLFYVPASLSFEESTGEIVLSLDPHLYIHKRAIDYISQELGASAAKLALSPITNRIIYLDPARSFLDEMEKILGFMAPTFDLTGEFDVRRPRIEAISSVALKLTKAAYFSAFDKADESLLNDYEALLTAINTDQKAVSDLFQNIIQGFLIDEPADVRSQVTRVWDGLPPVERLVCASPIPLNEEQRGILAALAEPKCRFITVQGPPGTGKSHTITAIAFDCILNGKSVLILSDKQEALDVVEDKLSSALSAVRPDDDFPNPILRLGRTGGTYTRLLSQAAQEKIRVHYKAANSQAMELTRETEDASKRIKAEIRTTIDAFASVRLPEIEELLRLEAGIRKQIPELVPILRQRHEQSTIAAAAKLFQDISQKPNALQFFNERFRSGSLNSLLQFIQIHVVAHQLLPFRTNRAGLGLFQALKPAHQPMLERFIFLYTSLRLPIFGYLFSRTKVRLVSLRLSQELPCTNSVDLHKRVADLTHAYNALVAIRQALVQESIPEDLCEHIYRALSTESVLSSDAVTVYQSLRCFELLIGANEAIQSRLVVGPQGFPSTKALLEFVLQALRYAHLSHKITDTMVSAPNFDYVGEKTKLERLYVSRMAHEIDRRFITFIDNKKAIAKTLGGVIKAKQQFPQDTFDSLKEAFPCIIAGIREFAEYVPLKQEIFDVAVIDEASQVSVAQAFPALLRARKVVVLGDQKQFSNVKSSQASIASNNGYLTDLDAFFRANVSTAADKVQRLKQFDVKKSVLEFFALISNYSCMLRKHFRGYQELISFSSKYFYDNQLQAIKVRGKPIEEVIRFTVVEPSTKPERHRNVNTPEATFILDKLRELIDNEQKVTVGVITPFREQQQYLTKLLYADEYASRFEDQLHLKIMTFDTCQGEEREIIFYSMVATPTQDLLNYIFPVDLSNTEERVEEMLKMQRLNVGLSRAQETIHFVLSKPIEGFHGSIVRALSHYHLLLNDKKMPDPEETDPASPMERRVLDWLSKTQFFQVNEEKLEVLAQFPVGDYLRQLDPTYHHPAYRCDFLLRYHPSENRTINIIIEYDGFAEHFTDHNRIHSGNYDSYYREQDVERQMVLESYGYKFLRINRFNLGSDPVSVLSDRIFALVESAVSESEAGVIAKIRAGVSSLNDGSARACERCKEIKPVDAFFDKNLKGGQGGHGRICTDCKDQAAPKARSGRRFRRRYWRRY